MSRSSIFILLIVLFIAGAWVAVNFYGWGIHPNQYQEYFGKKVILNGSVLSDPLSAPFGQISYQIRPEGRYSQNLLTSSSAKAPLQYGDKIYLIGKIKEPKNFSDYNYVNFLKSKNIYAEISNAEVFVISRNYLNPVVYFGIKVKHFVYRKFQENLPREQAALLIALIVGQKNLMSKNTVAAFQVAGVAHLIAVSGFILTLLIIFAEKFSPYVGWKNTWALCLAVAVIYIVMADFAAGVVRAAVMSGIFLISKKINRQYHLLAALGSTAAILIIQNPLIVRYDIGFALSFLSIVGIVLFAPILKILLAKLPDQFHIREIVSVTLAAQLITLPLTIFYFKQISLVAVFVNLLIIPIVPFILAIGYFLCLPVVGFVVGKIVILPLNYILLVVFGAARLKFASAGFVIGPGMMVGIYLAESCLYLLALSWLKEELLFVKME
jgi:competence protein ComEC